MTNESSEPQDFIVLRDSAGDYYLLPRTTIEDARVAEDARARIEAVLSAEADADVSGYGIGAPQATRFTPGAQQFSTRGIIVVGGYEGLRLAGIGFAPTLSR